MNITIHPSQWFHHSAMNREQATDEQLHQLMQSEVFWIFTIALTVLVVAFALTMLIGQVPLSNGPIVPSYPF
jgi:hypothetical protein